MRYMVSYKKPGAFFWHKVANVVGDTIIETDKGVALPVRVLFLEDKARLEIPMSCVIRFSKARFQDIQVQMEKEAGQRMSVPS